MLKHLVVFSLSLLAMMPASAEVVTVIDTPTDINTNGGWWPGLEIPRSVFIEAGVGSTFVFDYTFNEGSLDAKFRITTNWSNTLIPGFEPTPGTDRYIVVYENGSYSLDITEEVITLLTNDESCGWDGAVRIAGENFTITKAEFVNVKAGIDATIANSDVAVEYYNLQGLKVENPAKGIFIRRHGNDVKKIIIK